MERRLSLTGLVATAERQLESILQAAIRQLIPVRDFPRTLIQVTLQVTETPADVYSNAKIVQAQLVCRVLRRGRMDEEWRKMTTKDNGG
jgi:hypothetical protein